mgnify:FL=1
MKTPEIYYNQGSMYYPSDDYNPEDFRCTCDNEDEHFICEVNDE